MQNRLVVCLCNLKPAKMRGVESQAMVLCASTPEKVEILEIDPSCEPGDVIMCEPFAHCPDLPFMNPKKKIWEGVAPVGFCKVMNIFTVIFYYRIYPFLKRANASTKDIYYVYFELVQH